MKKCTKCKVPLEGLMAKISKLFGVKPSAKQEGVCNKCEDKGENVQKPTEEESKKEGSA